MNKRLLEILAKKSEIRKRLQGTEQMTPEDMDKMEEELRSLDAEQKDIERREKIANGIQTEEVQAQEVKKPGEKRTDKNKLDSIEYRTAFMKYVTKGTPIPSELRADANTTTGDVGAVVPPVTLNQIVEKIEAYGMILPLVNKTSYVTGVEIPTSSVKPVATWVAEGKGSDKQKKTTGSISFSHYKLRCAVSVSVETEYMALSAFEAALVRNISEAMAKALEQAIISGTGTGQPTGILKDLTVAADRTIATAKITYANLVEAEGNLPIEYENGAVWCMSKKTFMEFVAMTDSNGQPIARVNYGIGGMPERTLLGRKVILTNYITSFTATLKTSDVFAFLYNFADYTLNTNFQIGLKQYEDNDTDDIIRKSIMVCDGKPVVTESLVVLTGKATA